MIRLQDARYAFRLLGRSPGFTILTVLVLAGGLGVSIFTVSFLHTAMIRPLPLAEGERIVRVTRVEDGRQGPVDVVDLAAVRGGVGAVREVGGYVQREVILGGEGAGRLLAVTAADPVVFTVARTRALLGRTLLPADAEAGAEPVIVLSHRVWDAAFGADPAVVGSSVAINGVPTRVVGVMPPGFGFPVAQEAWLPLPAQVGAAVEPGTESVILFARLAPGATRAQAEAELGARLRHALEARSTPAAEQVRVTALVESFPAAQIGEQRIPIFVFLNVMAGLILLLALVNVTNLLMARANERARETAVRLALGASTLRLVVQGMWEGAILCLAGGALGTAGAAWALDLITRWTRANLEGNMTWWWVWKMDQVTLLGAGAFVTLTLVVLACVVAVHASRTNVRAVLQDGGARSGSRREGRAARGLVAAQVTALTVLMFVGTLSGVMAYRVVHVDPGYDPARLLQAGLTPPVERFPEAADRAAVYRDVQARLAEHSALDRVLLRNMLAERGQEAGRFVLRESAAPAPASAFVVATLGEMSTVGVDLVEGRPLDAGDDPQRPPVVVVSRSLAARHWRGRSPVGDQIRLAGIGDTLQWRTVVGVVSDIPYGNLLSPDRSTEAVYLPLQQAAVADADVVVRYRSGELAGRQALHQVFGDVDPMLVPRYVYQASEVIRKTGLIAVGLARLLGGCFVFALLLAVAGTYGLMSRAIGQRTREIGVRRALGASPAETGRMLLAQGARQLGIGTVAAAPLLLLLGGVAVHLLPIGAALTAAVGVLVSAAILGVVLGATWIPTRRVLRVPLRDALWRD